MKFPNNQKSDKKSFYFAKTSLKYLCLFEAIDQRNYFNARS